MKFRSQLDSTRFFYIQEGIAIGLISAYSKAFIPTFPILELFGFLGPILTIAFTIKTWADVKKNGEEKKP